MTKYDDQYAVYSDQKSTKEKMFKRIRKNFSTHQTKAPVADRIKVNDEDPEDGCYFSDDPSLPRRCLRFLRNAKMAFFLEL